VTLNTKPAYAFAPGRLRDGSDDAADVDDVAKVRFVAVIVI